jgi:predicted NBD/HSP70 family sugar kinase
MKVVAGVDLGGTAINYTFLTEDERFVIEGLCEHPARVADGPEICLAQIAEGLENACRVVGIDAADIPVVGFDTPGPSSATGVLSARGSTNFGLPEWRGFDFRLGVENKLGRPVTYLNDGNAAALWGHYKLFGISNAMTSVSVVIGTGLGGGVIIDGNIVIKGRKGFGGELGHVLIPWQSVPGVAGMAPPVCNCGRTGCLESMCSLTAIQRSLLPHFLTRYPGHELGKLDPGKAAKAVRGLAEKGDPLCRDIFAVQANALGLFLDEMVNTFDPDAFVVGGGAIETNADFQEWFIEQTRAGMPPQRVEQADIPIVIMPNGDTAGARGAAVDALSYARANRLI